MENCRQIARIEERLGTTWHQCKCLSYPRMAGYPSQITTSCLRIAQLYRASDYFLYVFEENHLEGQTMIAKHLPSRQCRAA